MTALFEIIIFLLGVVALAALLLYVLRQREHIKKLELDKYRDYKRFIEAAYACRDRNACHTAIEDWLKINKRYQRYHKHVGGEMIHRNAVLDLLPPENP